MAYRCAICGREDTSLLEAYIKDKGPALICPMCWERLMAENKIVVGSTGVGCPCG